MAEFVNLTEENFEEKVLKSDRPVMIDFWAPWCGPCRMLAPVFEELAEELGDSVVFAKVNVDDCMDLASAFRVVSIPMICTFKDGKPFKKTVGLCSKEDLKALLED